MKTVEDETKSVKGFVQKPTILDIHEEFETKAVDKKMANKRHSHGAN
jgi:hypothetical protein